MSTQYRVKEQSGRGGNRTKTGAPGKRLGIGLPNLQSDRESSGAGGLQSYGSDPSRCCLGRKQHRGRTGPLQPGRILHFSRHSSGSWAELETWPLIAQRLSHASADDVQGLLERVNELGRILNGLIESLDA